MTDLAILKIMSQRDKYDRFAKHIRSHTLAKDTQVIFSDMSDYYTLHPMYDHIKWPEFGQWFRVVKHPNWKEDRLELTQKIFDKVDEYDLDESLEKTIVESFIGRDTFTQIAAVALAGAEGDQQEISKIETILEAYYAEVDKVDALDNCLVGDDIEQIVSKVTSGGLRWRLPEFNLSLGPLRKGDFVLFGARPETGKTTMLASECSYMAGQIPNDKFVVYVNNEEEGNKVKYRIIQAALGVPNDVINADPVAAVNRYAQLVGHRQKIALFDMPSVHIKDIENIFKRYPPGLIIIDQLRKVKGFERSENDVGRLTALYQKGREWAKEYAPLITVHQVGGDGEGKKWLEKNQLYGAQTEVQGELDAQIMMGATPDTGNLRYINVVKNKLAGDDKTDKSLRHGKFEIEILPEIARYRSFLNSETEID